MALRKLAPVLRLGADDDKAFERLYERHVRDVYRYAAGMLGETAEAEDVTQTTFLNAYRAFRSGTRPEKPQSWLIAIAHNVCRQRFRQAQRRPREVAFDEQIGDRDPAEESTAPSADDLRRALSQLPPNQRAAVVMRELEGCSYAEIAQVLGISVSALETLLFRARRALREQLEEQLTCQDAALAVNRQLDGRLSLGERRALRAHLRACAACNSLARSQRAQHRALKTLVLVPLPATVSHWIGNQSAAAATGVAGAGGLTAVTATGGGAAGASSVVLGGVAAKAAAIVVAGVVVGGGTYAGVTRVERPAARSAERPSAVRVHVAPNGFRGEPIASARTFETPKSEAPTQTYGRTKAKLNPPGVAVRAAISKPAAVPRGQIVKTLVHDLQPLRTGPAARAAAKTRKATQAQAHTKQTKAKQTKAQNTQQRAERLKPAHPTRAKAKPAATTQVVVPRGRQKTIEPKTIEPKTPKPTP